MRIILSYYASSMLSPHSLVDTKEAGSKVSLPASNGKESTLVPLLVLERFGGLMPMNVSLKSIEYVRF
jgi:hypothetical protein